MTVAYLIAEIFARQQEGHSSNLRRITERQFSALRALILKEQGVLHGSGESVVWSPKGEWKYVLTENRLSGKPMLARFKAMGEPECGSLF